MQTKTFEVPTLFGDHHVIEVRRILLETPGVIDVYASSCFQIVEVTYDETKVNDLEIAVKLDNAGYLGEWTIPVEVGVCPVGRRSPNRFSATPRSMRRPGKWSVFHRIVVYSGRPLWPCPGMGTCHKTNGGIGND